MAKSKTDNHFKNLLMDTLAEFYQDYIKKEMASKDDLRQFATKDDLEKFATKADIEVSILDKIKNHEARIKVFEELQPLLTI